MRVLVLGSSGQLGRALMQARSDYVLHGLMRADADIRESAQMRAALTRFEPDVVINAAAFTDVDGAESEPDLAYAINAHAVGHLARICQALDVLLVHISTNEVFDGAGDRPYDEWDVPSPISVYARSKLAGERAARFHHDRLLIVRVAWLFAPGHSNFPGKILAKARKESLAAPDAMRGLRVVHDEFGNPTYAPDAAAALLRLLDLHAPPGMYHLTNQGVANRYELACEVLRQAGLGDVPVTPIPHSEWPRASQPPLRAVLANRAAAALGVRLRPWQEAVAAWAAAMR